jgi:hypothetical protein
MSDNDNNKSGKPGFEAEFARLESRLQELLVTVEALREENRALRQRQESLAAEVTGAGPPRPPPGGACAAAGAEGTAGAAPGVAAAGAPGP